MELNKFKAKIVMSRPKVLLTRKDFPKAALNLLEKECELIFGKDDIQTTREDLLNNVEGVDAIYCVITDQIDEELLDRAGSNLKVIATMSVGFDHIDVAAAKKRGIRVGYTPDVLTDATAEFTVAVLLAASRRLFEAHQEILNGGWARSNWSPMWLTGPGLANSTVGIFGLGRIGTGVMQRLRGFNVKQFLYNDIATRNDGTKWFYFTNMDFVVDAKFVNFDTLLKESDFIISTCALTDKTTEIFDERAFSLMKPSAVFVNTSRGKVVKQSALIEVLRSRKIFSAGLDVMDPEPLPISHDLLSLPNCVVLPHIASASWESRTNMGILCAKNILAGLHGFELPSGLC